MSKPTQNDVLAALYVLQNAVNAGMLEAPTAIVIASNIVTRYVDSLRVAPAQTPPRFDPYCLFDG